MKPPREEMVSGKSPNHLLIQGHSGDPYILNVPTDIHDWHRQGPRYSDVGLVFNQYECTVTFPIAQPLK
jgi:hypothetical protein